MSATDFSHVPGHDLVRRGLDDVAEHRATAEAALVLVASSRLRALGLAVPSLPYADWEITLYRRLGERDPDGDTYATYGAWLHDLDSFLDALDHSART